MNQLVYSLQAHRDAWVRYFTFSSLVFLAILLSPAAAQKFQLPDFLFVIVLPSCIVAIPFMWEFFFGVNAVPTKRIGIMGISFCLLLNQAIGVNRLPDFNHTSMTILQCLCFGLALNIGIWTNNSMDRSGGSAAS